MLKQPLNNCIITTIFPISTYEEALRKLDDVQTDVNNLKKRYKLGFISKYDYNKALIQLDQAKLNVYTATLQNFLIKEQIKAVANGYVRD